MTARVALVPGASGVVGRRVAEYLAAQPDWRVIGLARRPVAPTNGYSVISADLTDRTATQALARTLHDVTHIFYCARYAHSKDEPEPIEPNLAMLRNVVEAVEPLASGLEHVHLVQGSKYYGSELGPYKTPAKESDPRVAQYNWYDIISDTLKLRRSGFWETVDTGEMFLHLFTAFRNSRIIA